MTRLTSILALPFLALAACSPPTTETVPEPVALVTLEPAIRGDLPETVTGFGFVEFNPAGQRTLNAEIEARVLELKALPGETVKYGQVVLRLGTSNAAANDLVRARRDANTAQEAAERARRLREDGLASDADVEAAVTAAKDQTDLANSLEARAGSVQALRSPINGVVSSVLVEPGDLVAPGTTMVRLASPDAIQARIGIETEDIARFSIGDSVSLSALDKVGDEIKASIRVIDTRIDPATRMAAALITVPTPQRFLSGQAVRARIVADTRRGVIIVPRQSVFTDETGTYVFVADNGVAVLKRIEAGLTSGEQTEIVSGISETDTLIVDGAAILSDGMKIRTGAVKPVTSGSGS